MQKPLPKPARYSSAYIANQHVILSRYKKRKAVAQLLIFILAFLSFVTVSGQVITFTETPGTSGVENTPYVGKISATISNNDPLTYAAPDLPLWLTLNAGNAAPKKLNATPVNSPAGIARDDYGNYYVVPFNGTEIYKILPDGTTSLWATKPKGIAHSAVIVNNTLYTSQVAGAQDHLQAILKFDLNATSPAAEIVSTAQAVYLNYKDGYLYGGVFASGTIFRINLANNSSTNYATGFHSCNGFSFDASGNLLVALYNDKKIVKYNPATQTRSDIITGLPVGPTDVKIDEKGQVFVSMWGGKIRKYSADYSEMKEITESSIVCLNMTLTPGSGIVYGNNSGSAIYSLSTEVTITGTPAHEDVGDHPVKIRVTNGSITEDHDFVITVTDPNPPVITSYSPAVMTSDVPLGTQSVAATFSEAIIKGSGNVHIKNKTTDATLETVSISGSEANITGNTLTITLQKAFPSLTDIYIAIDPGTVKDLSGNSFAGIGNSSGWYFTTEERTQQPQTITFPASKTVTYGDDDFNPGAIVSSGLPVTYILSDESVATIIEGNIHIKKAGILEITAVQQGNDDYLAATPVIQTLTVSPRKVTITADARSKVYGMPDPLFTYKATGLVSNDQLTGQLIREAGKDAGAYKILSGSLSGGGNYTLEYAGANLTIIPANLVIKAENKVRNKGEANPVFTFLYAGFVGADKVSDLGTQPKAATEATISSPVGKYEIKVSGASSPNYDISYASGELTVMPVDDKRVKTWQSGSLVHVRIYSEASQKVSLTLLSSTGQIIHVQKEALSAGFNSFTVPVGRLAPDVYVLSTHAEQFREAAKVKID